MGVPAPLRWKEHGPNGMATKNAAKGRSLTMQSSERPAAIHSATPFRVTGSPDPNLVLRIDAEAILPSNWIQPKPTRS
ncbi:hypothetical protein V500_07249 [Pseudogymnoascus sp. VKM F-4518 (FW-2643)]|nr:hypothetical protein V500_07249 [Pseudogymnoascus sp. VKM F-4518 (FW-2643)]